MAETGWTKRSKTRPAKKERWIRSLTADPTKEQTKRAKWKMTLGKTEGWSRTWKADPKTAGMTRWVKN